MNVFYQPLLSPDESGIEIIAEASAEGYCAESKVWELITEMRLHQENYPEWYGENTRLDDLAAWSAKDEN